MRRWRVTRFGEPADVVSLETDAEELEPGPDQVKVRVEAAGLGLPDVFMCRDNYPLTPPLPFTPSQEAAGTVVAVGEGVDPALAGTRVLGPTLFLAQCGGLADFCLMHSRGVFPIPVEMSGVEAAGFFIPYQTAWIGLVRRAAITPDDTVLVLGASGSSGSAAVQLAKSVGARVIAIAGGPEKGAFCRDLGADDVIDHRSENITEAALALTGGQGVSVVYDPVGGRAGRAAFEATAFEGRFVIIGYASGEWPTIDLFETLPKNISLVGAMPVGYTPEFMQDAHGDLVARWRRGELRVSNSQVFPFEEGLAAIEHIAAGKVEGKVVVQVS
jgi:NADPH2:quinone reductase